MKKILLVLLLMMMLSTSAFADTEEPSVWAKEYVELVLEQNILNDAFFNGYKNYITRGEFAYLGVKLYEDYTGQTASVGEASFLDTSDEWVLKAKNTGFVGGYPDGTFLPDKEITREELAVLFVNVFNASGVEYLPADETEFIDDEQIASWAKNAVYIAKGNGIVNGVGANRFNSKGKATKEQALIMFNKAQTSTDLVFSGNDKGEFLVDALYPPEFILSKETIELGEFTKIVAKNIYYPELLYIQQSLTSTAEFIKNGDYYECILPATYYTALGNYTIEYGLKGLDEFSKEIKVVDRTFKIQYLSVDAKIESSTRTTEAYDQYNKYYKPALAVNKYEDTKKLSEYNPYVLPVNGRLSTEFGERRYVNGLPTSYNHAGLDIATSRGTQVVSTYKGQVVLAMELILTGNSVVISHGNGIFSTYFHLDKMNVNEGDLVDTGQLIGEVGTTGFSTGPHLHFSISYHTLNLEPGYFLYHQRVTKENYMELFNSK
jgi:murein DD-endopeptidase MepM/ murein hydrolase activator NlpD